MDERDDALREMAAHRRLKLVKSRRRKPGGDFGLYGLKDISGKEVLGFGDKGLTASADAIEAHLRDATRATWSSSAGAAKPLKPRPKPKPVPPPKPKPLPPPEVANLLAKLPSARRGEVFTELLARRGVKLERIVSHGQATPEAEPMVQLQDEWVIVLQGEAGVRIDGFKDAALGPGDYLLIAAGQRHWVTWTSKDVPTVWLALHLG